VQSLCIYMWSTEETTPKHEGMGWYATLSSPNSELESHDDTQMKKREISKGVLWSQAAWDDIPDQVYYLRKLAVAHQPILDRGIVCLRLQWFDFLKKASATFFHHFNNFLHASLCTASIHICNLSSDQPHSTVLSHEGCVPGKSFPGQMLDQRQNPLSHEVGRCSGSHSRIA
jgi:hypothetical protein